MGRVIQLHVKKQLADEILFGQLANGGGHAEVDYLNDDVVLNITPAPQPEPEADDSSARDTEDVE